MWYMSNGGGCNLLILNSYSAFLTMNLSLYINALIFIFFVFKSLILKDNEFILLLFSACLRNKISPEIT